MISYTESAKGVSSTQLSGFFAGWPNPPSSNVHHQILLGSSNIVLASDTDSSNVVGFITAISDGILCAYISLLEVLPEYRGLGIGQELVQRMLHQLQKYYVIDLVCDEEMKTFYKQFGLSNSIAMSKRLHENQSGRRTGP